jgi:hypothetical protein
MTVRDVRLAAIVAALLTALHWCGLFGSVDGSLLGAIATPVYFFLGLLILYGAALYLDLVSTEAR